MRVLVGALMVASLVSSAEASETLSQHLDWARKFAGPSDPSVTGSAGISPDAEVQPNAGTCPGADRRFDRLPFEPWRIIRCEPGAGRG